MIVLKLIGGHAANEVLSRTQRLFLRSLLFPHHFLLPPLYAVKMQSL